METKANKQVLIMGARGKIGRHAAGAFAAAGWQIRAYDRERDTPEVAARDCAVIVNGMNPPKYDNWQDNIPRITELAIRAARAANATVIVPGNIYNFGAQAGIYDETTAHRPHTRKGKIRVQMEETYRTAGIKTIVLRAGNFIDPNRQHDIMSIVLAKARKGRIMGLGPADIPQAWAYLPDLARAMLQLAEKRQALRTFEDVPFAGHTFSFAQLRDVVADHLQRPVKIQAFPWWLMQVLSPVWRLAREMKEMRYLSYTPHEISGVKLAQLLPQFRPTDLRTIMLAALPPQAGATEEQRAVA